VIGLLQHQRTATLAAHQANAGVDALLTFALDGPELNGALREEAAELLTDALKLALELERDLGVQDPDGERGQLLAACVKFLDGWAG
jgi:hypothetical protein